METFAHLSREALISLGEQQAELIAFLQQEILALRGEIETLKRGGKAPPLSAPEPPS